jgi:hypothetical protein
LRLSLPRLSRRENSAEFDESDALRERIGPELRA